MKTIGKIFKSIWNFFKNPKVKFWLISMVVVIMVSASVLSVIMLTTKIEYSKDLRPYANNIESIEVKNSHGTKVLKYNREPGAEKAINKILKKLYSSSKTNRFSQFINNEANGSEVIKYEYVSTNTLNSPYILIRFKVEAEQKYTITKPGPGKPYVAGIYDPDYPGDVTNPYPTKTEYHNNLVVNSIYIPLSDKNSFTNQTWYICVGNNYEMKSTSISYTYSTYGNYYKLYQYVSEIDDSTIF